MSLRKRIEAPTPSWFKKIIRIGLILAAGAAALLGASDLFPGFVLNHIVKVVAQNLVIGGIVAAAVAKTAKDGSATLMIIAAATLLSLASCSHKILPTISDSIKDSTHEEIKYIPQFKIITLPGDTVKLHDRIPCPDAVYHKQVSSATGKLKATVDINHGALTVDCNSDSLQARIDWLEKETLKERFRDTKTTITNTVTVTEYKVPKWCWYILIAVAGYIGVRIFLAYHKIPFKL